MNKFLSILCLGCLSIALSSCSKIDQQTLNLDIFELTINDSFFQKTENNETTKIFPFTNTQAAYIQEKNDIDPFQDSIILSKQDLSSETTLREFAESNKEYILNFYNLQNLELEESSFTCQQKIIPALLLSFGVPISNNESQIFFAQYFFVINNNGYILSFAQNEEADHDPIIKKLKTLSCN